MAFTYDLTTDRGVVRFNIGDTAENAGPRPDKRNFSDEEIDYLISTETDGTTAASALGFETLASEWGAYTLSEREGEVNFDAKEVSDQYFDLANYWRNKPGGGTGGNSLQAGVLTLDFMEKGDDTSR
jgi:hypothetical protein